MCGTAASSFDSDKTPEAKRSCSIIPIALNSVGRLAPFRYIAVLDPSHCFLTSSLQLTSGRLLRQATLGWRHGALPGRLVTCTVIVAVLALSAAAWQAIRNVRQADRLSARLAVLQSANAASAAAIQAAEPPDVIQTLPAAPGVAQVVQTLQQAADKEGARLMSMQAEDHPPTATALGHLDLALSIKAPYPSIVTVIQQVLSRYPGATLRQILVTPVASAAPAAMGASAAQPMTESEAHVMLAFWRRPLGVGTVAPAFAEQPASAAASDGASAAASAIASTSPAGATPLPPIDGAASALRK